MLSKRSLRIYSIVSCLVLMQGCTSMPDPGPITLTPDRVSTQPTTAPTIIVPTAVPYTATPRPATRVAALPSVTPIRITATPSVIPIPTTPTSTATPQPIVSFFPTTTPLLPSDIGTPTDVASDAALVPVRQNADWTPIEREFDGVPMVLVPIGCFMMGGEPRVDTVKSLPVHEQCFDSPFWIDKYEVTNEQFERFYSGINRVWRGAQQPHEGGLWIEARNVCALRGARLPTEKQWEYAARGPSSWVYPWGNEWNQDNDIWRATDLDAPIDVWMLDTSQSWVGAYHMVGNIAEWTSSNYVDYPYSDSNTDTSARDSTPDYPQHVIRGLARIEIPETFSRMAGSLDIGGVGFRCVRGFGS